MPVDITNRMGSIKSGGGGGGGGGGRKEISGNPNSLCSCPIVIIPLCIKETNYNGTWKIH